MNNQEFTKAIETELRREELDFKDLAQDFDFVVNLNTELARKYQDLMSSFPTVQEIDALLELVEHQHVFDYDQKTQLERVRQLKRFKSALVMLEKQDIRVLPPKYKDFDAEVDIDKELGDKQ